MMVVGVHYRAVNENVWFYLLEKYGGGPEINRVSADIYSEKPNNNNNKA